MIRMWIRNGWVPLGALMAAMVIVAGQTDASTPEALREARAEAEQRAERKQHWQEIYEKALDRIANARARITASEKAIRELRHRDRYQGEQREEVDAELEAAKRDLEKAQREVADFPNVARQAGVPPGWLREVEERRAREG